MKRSTVQFSRECGSSLPFFILLSLEFAGKLHEYLQGLAGILWEKLQGLVEKLAE